MRAVFIQYAHPATPHVSSLRLRHFAEALARRGHRIVLLTCTLDKGEKAKPAAEVEADLARHDWSRPYLLACAPRRRPSLERIRDPKTPRRLRQALIVWHYGFGEGLFSDWTWGSRAYWPLLAERFRPDVTWGTFGSLDSWAIARGLAKAAKVPWVADAKDGWEVFIPPLLRRWLAWRFRGAAALTANSGYLAEQFGRWFPLQADVIYSGVDASWLKAPPPPTEGFRIMLVGGVYNRHNLARLVEGLRAWLERLPAGERGGVSVGYAGSDAAQAGSALAGLAGLCRADVRDYLPLGEMASLCRGAAVNIYLWNPKTFHHKLVELLCCQRPVISFPGERGESLELARQAGGSLSVCRDGRELGETLEQIWRGGLRPSGNRELLQRLTWPAQAERLEAVLRRAAAGGTA